MQKAQQKATRVALTSSATAARLGQTITLKARVSSTVAGAAAPSGTVRFKDGSTVLGKGTVKNGVAIFHLAGLKKGKHALTVVFGGDANLTGSTSIILTETIG